MSKNPWITFCMISIGSLLGVLIRWRVNDDYWVNIVGAGLIGFVSPLPLSRNAKVLFISGFCGSLTTFSTWIVKSTHLFISGDLLSALMVIAYTIIFGIISVGLGFLIGNKFNSKVLPQLSLLIRGR